MFGSVPETPESRFPTPSALRAPCTTRKSVARGLRWETRWMATPSPMVSMARTRVTTTKAGSSAQNSTPGVTSNPGHDPRATPTHGASSIGCTSNSPKGAATAQPTTMPMTGDHRRHAGAPRSSRATTTTRVARAAATSEVPSGTTVSEPNTMGMTVAAISIITVPETTGVNMRRSSDSRAASANWNSDDTTTRLAMVAGPPFASATAHTAMKAPDVPITSTLSGPDQSNPDGLDDGRDSAD